MIRKMSIYLILAGALLLLAIVSIAGAQSGDDTQMDVGAGALAPLGTSFTYQGQLKSGGKLVDDTCTMAFRLYDAAEEGAGIGSAITRTMPITNGTFTVQLDFGSAAFTGDARWLGIRVQCTGDTADTDLGRQPLTAAPYALYALGAPWGGLLGVPPGFADGVDDVTAVVSGTNIFVGDGLTLASSASGVTMSIFYAGSGGDYGAAVSAARSDHAHDSVYALLAHVHPGNDITSAVPTATLALTAADAVMLDGQPGAAYQRRVTGVCEAGNAIRVVNADGSVTCEPVSVADDWSLTGNAGTNPGVNFLGTTDDVGLTLAVNGMPALRLLPNITSPNVIGGYSGNRVTAGVVGATIGGGGLPGTDNRVTDNYGTIGGGTANQAGDDAGTTDDARRATVSGGYNNVAGGYQSTVGGGGNNDASGSCATVSGGTGNLASDYYAVVGGGSANVASSDYTAIGGGYANTASAYAATVSGGYSNTVAGNYAVVSGGYSNTVAAAYAIIGGGYENTTSGQFAIVGGGGSNVASGDGAVVAGGGGYSMDANIASGNAATIGGGRMNRATGPDGTVGGGRSNAATGGGGACAGGSTVAGGVGNEATDGYATIGGGFINIASNVGATVGGGGDNEASGFYANIAGGHDNTVTNSYGVIAGGDDNLVTGKYGVVAGGFANVASAISATVGGGSNNAAGDLAATVGGGYANAASDDYASVCGGWENTASGVLAVVSGGAGNTAGAVAATVGGGTDNSAGNNFATVSGGTSNSASGHASTVPGGLGNVADGRYSFAAGNRAQANHQGAFVWGDSTDADIVSTKVDQFVVRASNGVSLSADAGYAKTIDVGERYRDNAIVAWAKIQLGAVQGTASFGVESVTHIPNSGIYTITLDASAYGVGHLIPIAVAEVDNPPVGAASVRIVSIDQIAVNQFLVYINNGNWVLVDNDFVFMVTAR